MRQQYIDNRVSRVAFSCRCRSAEIRTYNGSNEHAVNALRSSSGWYRKSPCSHYDKFMCVPCCIIRPPVLLLLLDTAPHHESRNSPRPSSFSMDSLSTTQHQLRDLSNLPFTCVLVLNRPLIEVGGERVDISLPASCLISG